MNFFKSHADLLDIQMEVTFDLTQNLTRVLI